MDRQDEKPGAQSGRTPFYQKMMFRVFIGLLIFDVTLLSCIILLMNSVGERLVLQESNRIIEATGAGITSEVNSRLRTIEGLARSLANMGEQSPADPDLLKKMLINVIDFDGDLEIAGGGIWFEPNHFRPGQHRYSLFWGRDKNNKLQFFDDYNAPGPVYDENRFKNDEVYRKRFLQTPGYHNEEWYVVVRHLAQRGKGFWSGSYIDPYSGQPMVTVTVAMRDRSDRFIGVTTIDLKLEGIREFLTRQSQKSGGYIFLTDRNGKFISFPRPELARTEKDYLTIGQLKERIPAYGKIADHLQLGTGRLLRAGGETSDELAATIDRSSYQIDRHEARIIAALVDRKNRPMPGVDTFTLERDHLLDEKSIVSVFQVPDAWWNLVIVKPASQYVRAAVDIRNTLLVGISIIVAIIFCIALAYQIFFVVKPLNRITSRVEEISEEIEAGTPMSEITENFDAGKFSGEFRSLNTAFSTMQEELIKAETRLKEHNLNLEEQVAERTRTINNQTKSYRGLVRVLLHDISNPLTIIQSSAHIGHKTKKTTYYEKIKRAASLIFDTINQVRDHEALASGKKSLTLKPVDMDDVVRDLEFLFQDKADDMQVELTFDVRMDGQPVLADMSSLTKEILSNIISNAIKFCMPGGHIRVGISRHEDKCCITITDDGIGIPPDILAGIFDHTSNTSRPGTKGEKGTGFGMPLVQSYVQKHGGTIRVDTSTEPGQSGTTFTITLPMAKPLDKAV